MAAAVELELDDGIAVLRLNRPEGPDTLSMPVLAALESAAGEVASHAGIRGVVLTGAGKSFASGASVDEIARLDATSGVAFARRGHEVLAKIEALEKPVLAAVDGFALGGGCELAMACHLRIATTRARFGQPEVKLGIPPGFGGTQRLPRLIGRARATELILTGRAIRAAEAQRIGLIHEVVPPPRLLERAFELLREILAARTHTLALALRVLHAAAGEPLAAGLEREARGFADTLGALAQSAEGTP